MYKVMNGGRPERPSSGFTGRLWDLLTETWLEQYVDQPQKRPPVSTILNRLKEDVDHRERTIHPVAPKQLEGSGEYCMSLNKYHRLLRLFLQ